MTPESLKSRLDEMSTAKLRFVARMVDALQRSPQATVKQSQTWITGSAVWLEYFGLALSVHHGATSEPLLLESFETVFRGACESAEWELDPQGSPTRRFVDLVVDDGDSPRRLSLKSTAARNLREDKAHISKLTEAAWIQDARTAKLRRDRVRELFKSYLGTVDAILMLRAFRRQGAVPYRYQLLEIPSSIFASLLQLPLVAFQRDPTVLHCIVKGRVVAGVALDRSDAKITVRNIDIDACVVHVEWYCEEVGS